MRRPIDRLLVSIAIPFLLASLVLSGCGGGGKEAANESPEVSGMLRKVRSAAELESALKSSLSRVTAVSLMLPPAVTVGAGADYTSTYTVEAGVDEFDYVRYDGTYLYIAPDHGTSPAEARAIRILRTDPASGNATQVGSIPVDSDRPVQGMYVANGRLVMVTNQSFFLPFGDAWTSTILWQPTRFGIHVYDVSDPAHPERLLRAEVDGSFVDTRLVGDRVYLVSRHWPSVATDPSGRPLLANLTLADLLPGVTVEGRTEPLFAPSDCYVTSEGDSRGYLVLTTITSFSMQNPASLASICYDEEANGVYASTSALYISQPRTGAISGHSSATRIHKFALTAAVPTYAGSVEIPGLLWTGGQADFRINEHQGMLRVVTTELTSDTDDLQDHRLFVLRPKPQELALEVLSKLPNDAHPAEIGKPNEGLFGVRFIGDRAYAITFRAADPLYVLDLANPANPRIAGELAIPGFSSFLHPVTDGLLLGLGSDVNRTKIELFDVAQIGQPQSRGRIVIDGRASYSEAEWDRHAFTYLPSDTVDRFAIPETVFPPDVHLPPQTNLHQFEILGKQNAGSASLQAAGILEPPPADEADVYFNSSRSFIHGDTVYFVRNGKVWSAPWFAPSQLLGPF